ncbi:MAG: DEAD/DEAH box helicase [Candidatus Izimaplasma sp.]|nr:DEAD/DEAH box helicase [Candidatus Izimaplasma bacterium]
MDLKKALDLLNLDKDYSEEELAKSFREKAEKYLPHNKDKMEAINEAYDTLKTNEILKTPTHTEIETSSADFDDFIYNDELIKVVLDETISQKTPTYGELDKPLPNKLQDNLDGGKLYSHQAEAIRLIRQNKNVILSTPTSSGKSYAYFLPFFEEVLKDKDTTGIFIFPVKALSNDQQHKFEEFNIGTYAKYDGDIDTKSKKCIRNDPPSALFTNPDSLHMSILQTHTEWEDFFSNLKFIVLDELHYYKGFFGSNTSNILFRLLKVAQRYGGDPRIICTSATIPEGEKFAKQLAWKDFQLIEESGAGRSEKQVMMIEPQITEDEVLHPLSLLKETTIKLFNMNKQTIIFCNSRITVDTAAYYIKTYLGEDSSKISGYHAGYTKEERLKIETKFKEQEIEVLITTNAMELGIDIGDLDACILYGLPHQNSAIWQRIGRAGRSYEKQSLALIINTDSKIDKYFFENPDQLMDTKDNPEEPIISPYNKVIRKRHLQCALFENIKEKDLEEQDKEIWDELDSDVNRTGHYWAMPIRSSWGIKYDIIDQNGDKLNEINYDRVYKDLHYGAIYRHKDKFYKRTKYDKENKRVYVEEFDNENKLTSPFVDSFVFINEISEEKIRDYPDIEIIVGKGKVSVINEVKSYIQKDLIRLTENYCVNSYKDGNSLRTKSVWVSIPKTKEKTVLHSVSHLMIRKFVQKGHCDWQDFAAVTIKHPHFNDDSGVFFYDNCPGGIQLADKFYEEIDDLFAEAYDLVSSCPCEGGCRACLLMKKRCNKFDRELDKENATQFLAKLANQVYTEKDRNKPLLNFDPVPKGEYKVGDDFKDVGEVIDVADDEIAVNTGDDLIYIPIEDNKDED